MGFWSGLKKTVKTVGGGAWKGVKWGGGLVKDVVEVPVDLLKSVGGSAEKVVAGAGDLATGTMSSVGTFTKIIPFAIIGVIGLVLYWFVFKGGSGQVAGAVG